ncbi:MAG: T9SS type A sorting domain-containing protein [Bacteroidota bacterium]|nr:T9SS type A sorting domain-containing protein [Bacteroidota bacterium]
MKRYILLMALFSIFIFFETNAQQKPQIIKKQNIFINTKPDKKKTLKFKSLNDSGYNNWVGTTDVIRNYKDDGTFDWNNYIYAEPVFPDTIAQLQYRANKIGNVNYCAFGSILDLSSALYDTYSPSLRISNSNNQSINFKENLDSIMIWGAYERVSNSSVVDTLILEVVYGLPDQPPFMPLQTDSPKYYFNGINYTVGAGLSGPNKKVFKEYLTAKDTTPSGMITPFIYSIDNINIPANNIVGVSITFKPGSNYTSKDILYSYDNNVKATLNSFSPAFYQPPSISFFDSTSNGNNVSLDNWARYGKYTGADTIFNQMLAPEFDYGYLIDFHITADALGINNTKVNNLTVSQNIPNPAQNSTTINYELVKSANVSIDVFDITGKKVISFNYGKKPLGKNSISIDTSKLKGGIYFYTFNADGVKVTRKMTVIGN